MKQPFEIVIDAQRPAALARFWAQALPSYKVRHYDDDEIARLAKLGLTPETDTSVAIDGDGPTIWFQKSDQPTTSRNRIHLDLMNVPKEEERDRLAALGGRAQMVRDDHIVMHDPEGNQFCLFDPKEAQ